MSRDNTEDLQDELEFIFLSLLSKKLNVGIIGGGKGGLIKARTFLNSGANLWVLSRDFIEEFKELQLQGDRLIKGEYYTDFIKDKHIVLVAVEDLELKKRIKDDCEKTYKIFIDSTSFINGMGLVPAQKQTKNISFSVHTKGGNPKAAMLLLNKSEEEFLKYDEFIGMLNPIRNKAKKLKRKTEIINFINTEDFKFFYERGYIKEILMLFFDEDDVNYLLKM